MRSGHGLQCRRLRSPGLHTGLRRLRGLRYLRRGARAAGQIASDATLTKADWVWAYTEMYMGINHEVAPAMDALGSTVGCVSCHGGAQVLIDYDALGYSCDPFTGGGATACRMACE